jgi:hypothetical protein
LISRIWYYAGTVEFIKEQKAMIVTRQQHRRFEASLARKTTQRQSG